MTCEEYKKENGLSGRRQVEEAMSEALIRKCNKCGTPFIKEEGCNKMQCVRPGCRNVQCYICSKSCNYSHFNDRGRGGKAGNCPLFEVTEERHQNEVKNAENVALDKVLAENPDLSREDLQIKMSDAVRKGHRSQVGRGPGQGFAGVIAHRNAFMADIVNQAQGAQAPIG
jgi:TRIAD3 protein (E3 ubiquitin-protein ligase RNF216)